MPSINDDRPSSADSLIAAQEENRPRPNVDEAVKAIEEAAASIGRRSTHAYETANEAVNARVDALPGMLLCTAAGFLAGAWWASRRDY